MNINYLLKTVSFIITALFLMTASVASKNISGSTEKLSNQKDVVLILDASRSMWGQVHGVTKVSIAKNKMKELLRELPGHLDIGLMTYGHRSKTDCNDIEFTNIQKGSNNINEVFKFVDSITPKGKTPIAQSIGQAMKHLGDGSSLVLLSDGKETCGLDPCERVKQLKKEGIDFVAHVIGFDVNEETKNQLGCVAKEGGGEFFAADSEKELKAALTEIKNKIIKKASEKDEKIKSLSEEINKLKRNEAQISKALEQCEKDMDDCKKQNKELLDKINQLTKAKQQLQKNLAFAEESNQQLKEEVAKNKDSNARQTELLNKEIENIFGNNEYLKNELDGCGTKINELNGEVTDCQNRNKELADTNRKLQEELSVAKGDNKRLGGIAEKLEQDLNSCNSQNNALDQTNNNLEKQLLENKDLINDLENKNRDTESRLAQGLADKEQENSNLLQQLNGCSDNSNVLKNESDQLNNRLLKSTGIIQRLHAENSALKDQIAKILARLLSIIEDNQ